MKRFLLWVLLCLSSVSYAKDLSFSVLDFSALDQWELDDHDQALSVFLNTCTDLKEQDWQSLCALGQQTKNAKQFFELFFRPVRIEDDTRALITGYFEPELNGSLIQTSVYKYPVYAEPREARQTSRWLTRRQIETSQVMKNRDLEIAWVDDPVELFFLQIQGSGRIRLTNGNTIRLGYAGSNGHNYKSVGSELVRRGIYEPHQVSAGVIKNWVKRNPVQGRNLLFHNPSYVFFRTIDNVSSDRGPLGAMNRSITANRSIAVDPKFVKLGAPVWLEMDGENSMRRLMVAQDTGSAIKGAQRADVFFGTGYEAGRKAGRLRNPGQLTVLLPIQRAYASLIEQDP